MEESTLLCFAGISSVQVFNCYTRKPTEKHLYLRIPNPLREVTLSTSHHQQLILCLTISVTYCLAYDWGIGAVISCVRHFKPMRNYQGSKALDPWNRTESIRSFDFGLVEVIASAQSLFIWQLYLTMSRKRIVNILASFLQPLAIEDICNDL